MDKVITASVMLAIVMIAVVVTKNTGSVWYGMLSAICMFILSSWIIHVAGGLDD